jgi:endonuclease/exonuclease/phosphatase (EEP) superfamily protein YafD
MSVADQLFSFSSFLAVLLVQEINLKTEEDGLFNKAHNTSKTGHGTAIYCKSGNITNIRQVESPHAEVGGCIRKKTTIATCDQIDFVSFHGYNGQPMKVLSKLLDHVRAVLVVLAPTGPTVFAGDFNTWSDEHVQAVGDELQKYHFVLAHSWPYPGRDVPLDHVFIRGDLQITVFDTFANASDHHGAVFELNRT